MTRKKQDTPKIGRPPIPDNERRSWNLNVRARADQRDAWHEAAVRESVDLSDVVRSYLDRWARRSNAKK